MLAISRGWLQHVDKHDVSKELMRAWTTRGDKQMLMEYVDENHDQLVADAKKDREEAEKALKRPHGAVPYRNAEWISLIEDDEYGFHDRLRTATADRKDVSKRVESEALNALPRIRPIREPTHVGPLSKLIYCDQGFVAVTLASVVHVFFMRKVRGEIWAMG